MKTYLYSNIKANNIKIGNAKVKCAVLYVSKTDTTYERL